MDIDVTKSFRRTRILECYICNDIDPLYKSDLIERDHLTVVRITKDDFFEQQSNFYTFSTRDEAEEWVSKQKIGEVLEKRPLGVGRINSILKDTIEKKIADISSLSNSVINSDYAYPLCAEILAKAGVRNSPFGGLEVMCEWLTPEEVDWYENQFGDDNWSIVAELAYCTERFSTDSLAYRAAEVMFHYYITENDVTFGYLYRDLLVMQAQLEKTAIKATDASKKAGQNAGKSHNKSKIDRIRAFLKMHVKVLSENPLLRDDPADQIAYRALKLARKLEPELFNKVSSKKIAIEYWEYIVSDPILYQEYKEETGSYVN
jgi:hypothetical protein